MEQKIEWVKCHHDHELRYGKCPLCEQEKRDFLFRAKAFNNEPPKKIAIYRGCNANAMGGCFCDGSCKEIIGYREPLYAGEKQPQK